jgi:hypothetical protein
MKRRLSLLFCLCAAPAAWADGHGPVFGLATPTNSQGEWSFDTGVFGRANDLGSVASFRELIGYGFTPHVTLFVTAPAVAGNLRLTPTRIQPGADFDATVKWRFSIAPPKSVRALNPHAAGVAAPGPQSASATCHHERAGNAVRRRHRDGVAQPLHWLERRSRSSTNTRIKAADVSTQPLVYGYRPPKWRRARTNGTGGFSPNSLANVRPVCQAGIAVPRPRPIRCSSARRFWAFTGTTHQPAHGSHLPKRGFGLSPRAGPLRQNFSY